MSNAHTLMHWHDFLSVLQPTLFWATLTIYKAWCYTLDLNSAAQTFDLPVDTRRNFSMNANLKQESTKNFQWLKHQVCIWSHCLFVEGN